MIKHEALFEYFGGCSSQIPPIDVSVGALVK